MNREITNRLKSPTLAEDAITKKNVFTKFVHKKWFIVIEV